jgi:hypothetical protein
MASLVRLIAVLSCILVVLGFAGFVSDEAGGASKGQVAQLGDELKDPVPSASDEALRQREHSRPRELIDDANDYLLSPFTGFVDSHSAWVRRIVPTVLALLAYGVGLMLLANMLPGPRRRHQDWKTA